MGTNGRIYFLCTAIEDSLVKYEHIYYSSSNHVVDTFSLSYLLPGWFPGFSEKLGAKVENLDDTED